MMPGYRRAIIIAPRRPTRKRLRFLANHRGSMLRALEEEIITSLQFHGRLLDVGGGASSAYNRLLPKNVDVQSLNINPSTRPSVVAYANRAFPFGDKAFDAVISFNTLEHVYGAGLCLERWCTYCALEARFTFFTISVSHSRSLPRLSPPYRAILGSSVR